MSRVFASLLCPHIKCLVGPEIMDQRVLSAFAVKRPLDCPGTNDKMGTVLSHSAVVLFTEKHCYVLVEYMSECKVIVSKMPQLHIKDNRFGYRNFSFILDSPIQQPKMSITVRDFAMQMVEYTKNKPFDTFTHNCHIARFRTMRKYGMKSPQPTNGSTNTLFQGVIDYFRPAAKI